MTHIAFPSLELFSSVNARETYQGKGRRVTFGAKIKLHGTNIGVRVEPDGTVTGQSRKHDVSAEHDANDFFARLETQKEIWAKANAGTTLTFFGEWAGPGVNKGDAVQQTDKTRFYIFAVGVGTMPHPQTNKKVIPQWMITDPNTIASLLPDLDKDEVRVLPWESFYTFDFHDESSVEKTLETLNTAVDAIAKEDPYIKRTYGISHPGEGLVLVEMSDQCDMLSGEAYSRSSFKAKTEKHRVRKQGKPATAKEPLPENALAFVDAYVTPARLEQAIDETCPNNISIKQTGAIMGWMMTDIAKEGADELEKMGLSIKQISGEISTAVRALWMAKL